MIVVVGVGSLFESFGSRICAALIEAASSVAIDVRRLANVDEPLPQPDDIDTQDRPPVVLLQVTIDDRALKGRSRFNDRRS